MTEKLILIELHDVTYIHFVPSPSHAFDKNESKVITTIDHLFLQSKNYISKSWRFFSSKMDFFLQKSSLSRCHLF